MSQKELNSTEIKGKEVVGPLGRVLGKVSGLNFDPTTWQITTLQVSLDSKVAEQIGVKKTLDRFGIRHTEMPIKASFVGQVGDKILLKVSEEELVKYVTELRIDDTTKHIKIPPG